ncbi:MAG: PqqD family peptide modification chaperone [Candidatus Omnitrophica bacterium]|nr:PqqD family peptide modification chaperone [Candidatus Omnitrophota bacterium]
MDMTERVPVRAPDIVVRSEKEESLLFNPLDGSTVCVNATGQFIWELCDGENSVGDIVSKLHEVFDAGDDAGKDCLEYLSDMESKGFICYLHDRTRGVG